MIIEIFYASTSASSIKTRIKTEISVAMLCNVLVLVHLPLKQGLRPFQLYFFGI